MGARRTDPRSASPEWQHHATARLACQTRGQASVVEIATWPLRFFIVNTATASRGSYGGALHSASMESQRSGPIRSHGWLTLMLVYTASLALMSTSDSVVAPIAL